MADEYCSVAEMRSKEVVNISDGYRLGFVHDINFDVEQGRAVSIIILGARRFFGLFGREEDYIIAWSDISKIGADVILVDIAENSYTRAKARKRQLF